MKPCDGVRERLIDLHYGWLEAEEPSVAEACRRHLAGCGTCAAELETLSLLDGSLRAEEAYPRESEVRWETFARRIVERATAPAPGAGARIAAALRALMPKAPASGWGLRPAWVAASLLVVTGAVAAMMMMSNGEVGTPEGGPAARVEMPEGNIDNLTVALARQNTERYLNETRAVLVTLLDVNIHCEKGRVDVSAERAKATELLRRQRLVAAELNRLPLARAQDVCSELERLLLEISTLADCTRDDDIQTLRDVVEKRQILVRMELLTQELARRSASHV